MRSSPGWRTTRGSSTRTVARCWRTSWSSAACRTRSRSGACGSGTSPRSSRCGGLPCSRGRERAGAVAPSHLARWLSQGHDDDGRPVTLLDTRNAFEVAHGTFRGARHLGIERFDAFPAAVDALPEALRDETVVTFCTGGIRCEKAALYLRDRGYPRVLQLDGGILGYFEQVGGAHWDGACFVFDARVALTSDLAAIDETITAPTSAAPVRPR